MNKKQLKPIVITMSVLILICFAALVINVFDGGFSPLKLPPLLSYVMAFLYLFFLYKKPHGNDIKIMYLVYAVTTAIAIDSENAVRLGKFLIPVCVVLIAFMAGRLHRIDQNKIIIPVVAALLLIATAEDIILHANLANALDQIGLSDKSAVFKASEYIKMFSDIVMFGFISSVYAYRYDEHIAVGKSVPRKK